MSRDDLDVLAGRLEGAEVLVVDDDLSARELLRRALEGFGCHAVRTEADGQSAVRAIRTTPPDVVLLDLSLPDIDGRRVLELLRAERGVAPDLPVIVLTADGSAAARLDALERGATDFLTKPIDLVEVGLRVANLVSLQRLHRATQVVNEELQVEIDAGWRARLAERSKLIDQLVWAQEDERARVARELHDSTVQQLTALALGLESAAERPSIDHEVLGRLAGATRRAIDELRAIVQGLRPPVLDDVGLDAALRQLVEELVDLDVRLDIDGERPQDGAIDIEIYRICQALLANVVNHAAADHATVSVRHGPEGTAVEISDDGLGFEPPPLASLVTEGHLGLAMCHERAALLGGDVEIAAEPGVGTTVTVQLPPSNVTTGRGVRGYR